MELSKEYQVPIGRNALSKAIIELSPDPDIARQLEMIAVAGQFADLLSISAARDGIVDIANDQLEKAGFRVVNTRRN